MSGLEASHQYWNEKAPGNPYWYVDVFSVTFAGESGPLRFEVNSLNCERAEREYPRC
jgi:hypothetical protein